MRFRIERLGFRFYIGIDRILYVDGYNSMLSNGKHFLMWDFDDESFDDVMDALLLVQKKFRLPRIWIIPTGSPLCYHANCFKAFPWEQCRGIVASTPLVDEKFVAIGILRGFLTLRYSPLPGKAFTKATILPSKYEEDVDPFTLTSFITYPKKRR